MNARSTGWKRLQLASASLLCTASLAGAGEAVGADPTVLLTGEPGGAVPSFKDADRAEEREAMVREHIAARAVSDPRVLRAMRRVPRHRFVPEPWRTRAYADSPLPITADQTISQPYIVAFMAAVLQLEPGDRVLEVGTGSGYHAAVLGQLADHVVTIEIVESLARTAAARLRDLGYDNITVLEGDGHGGWPPGAPYDAILATAAPEQVPPALIDQLAAGGRLVIPVGGERARQELVLIEKDEDGAISRRELMAVRFVPLTREQQAPGADQPED